MPRTIPGFEVDGTVVLTSDEVFELQAFPQRVAVIGGGAIGCEFASMFCDLGSQVTVLEALPEILPGVDNDVVSVRCCGPSRSAASTSAPGSRSRATRPASSGTTVAPRGRDDLEVDAVVVSVGRRPLSDEPRRLTARASSVDGRGFVEVDELCRTAADGVCAIGDLIATPGLAHVGFAEAILVIKQLLGEAAVPVDYGKVPWCIYCHPEVAFVGLLRGQAQGRRASTWS